MVVWSLADEGAAPGAQAAQVKIDGWVNDGPAGTIVRLSGRP
jgi:hypothetical protein